MNGSKILVVDDDPRILRLVRAVLEFSGFRVSTTVSGTEALRLIPSCQPELVIVDVQLVGELDGFELCREIRADSSVPIIMLTARGHVADKVRGFDLGADDYITKPFESAELVARARAALRRSGRPDDDTAGGTLAFGDLAIDLDLQSVTIAGRKVELTPTEFRLLLELARNRGRVVGHRELLTRVWGADYEGERDYLRTYVRRLRRKIEANPTAPQHIISKPGAGYWLGSDLET